MNDACYTARPTNRANALERIQNLQFRVNPSGQYEHDDITSFFASVEREMLGMYNPLEPGKGMAGLLDANSNRINRIKSVDVVTPEQILKESRDEAAAISRSTGATATPAITSRSDAQDEADRRNHYHQAVIGVKEGVKEAIVLKVGTDVTDPVLRDVNGQDYKGIDDFTLHQLKEAVIAGADRPNTPDVLKQLLAAINFVFDFRKKVSANVEQLNSHCAKLQSYGISVDPATRVLNILANTESAMQHDWGRELRPAMQTIRGKYPYNHKHDESSLQDILTILAGADSVRLLREAPEPTQTESANSVAESYALLQQMMHQPAESDYEESAFAAQSSGSESDDSSTSDRRARKKSTRRDRSRNRGTRGGRSRSRHRDNQVKNKCKHCKEFRQYSGEHDPDKCFYNKSYKGWRPSKVCMEIGMTYRGKGAFTKDMGGWLSDDE